MSGVETGPRRVLSDTSVLIEPLTEQEIEAHGLAEAEQAISVVTIAELHMGTLVSDDAQERAARLRRLAAVEARHETLALDADAARVLGRYMAEAKRAQLRLRTSDAIIAATAEANDLTVVTRDRDFQRFGVDSVVLAGTRGAPRRALPRADHNSGLTAAKGARPRGRDRLRGAGRG